jgi:integral membrane sensor domain MASE1
VRRIENLQEWLYLVIASAMALYLVIGIIAWTWMIFAGVAVPSTFATVLAAVVGSLAGILSPLRAPGRTRDEQAAG